jgi:hypothetical protein
MSQYDTSVTRRGCLHEHSRGSAPCTSNVQIPPMKETQSCIWTSTGFTRQPCRSFKPDSTPPLRQCISDVELSSSAPLGTLAFRLLPRSLRLPCPIPRRDPRTESYQQRIVPLDRTIIALITEEAFRSRWSPVLLSSLVAMRYVPCYVTGCVGAMFTAMSPTELWQPDS